MPFPRKRKGVGSAPKMKSEETKKIDSGKKRVLESFDQSFIMEQEPFIVWSNEEARVWDEIVFFLPMAPSLNAWTRIFNNTVVASPAAKLYISMAWDLVKSFEVAISIRKLEIEVDLHGLPARSDADNRLKQTLDSLQGCLFHNDYQCRKITIEDMETPTSDGVYMQVTVRSRK